jgi:hypothetical protein
VTHGRQGYRWDSMCITIWPLGASKTHTERRASLVTASSVLLLFQATYCAPVRRSIKQGAGKPACVIRWHEQSTAGALSLGP